GKRGLPTTGLPDDTQGLPLPELKANPVDGVHGAAVPDEPAPHGKVLHDVLDGDDGLGHGSISPTRWHATSRPGSISRSSGTIVCPRSSANGHRGWNAHPGGIC